MRRRCSRRLEDQAAAKEIITKQWDAIVGANVQ